MGEAAVERDLRHGRALLRAGEPGARPFEPDPVERRARRGPAHAPEGVLQPPERDAELARDRGDRERFGVAGLHDRLGRRHEAGVGARGQKARARLPGIVDEALQELGQQHRAGLARAGARGRRVGPRELVEQEVEIAAQPAAGTAAGSRQARLQRRRADRPLARRIEAPLPARRVGRHQRDVAPISAARVGQDGRHARVRGQHDHVAGAAEKPPPRRLDLEAPRPRDQNGRVLRLDQADLVPRRDHPAKPRGAEPRRLDRQQRRVGRCEGEPAHDVEHRRVAREFGSRSEPVDLGKGHGPPHALRDPRAQYSASGRRPQIRPRGPGRRAPAQPTSSAIAAK